MKTKLILIFLMLTSVLYSQNDIRRMFLHDTTKNINFTRRYNSYALAFKSPLCCDPDTIWVSTMSDSIDVNKTTFNLFTYFPLNINPINSTMILNYTDGTNEILYQIGFPSEQNYVEYYVVSRQYQSIFNKKVKSITFRGIGTFKVKDKLFFSDFCKSLKL